MYINPETNILLLKNVPLDTSYEHTIFFGSAADQVAYFRSKAKFNLNSYTYQRVGAGVSRVGIKSDDLYDCNYMMFQNSSFGNKWFYAYIKKVEYINNITSEITFEIDVMQTWFFEHTPDYCFVAREHSETDAIGEHIEAEPVDTGEYVFMEYDKIFDFQNMHVIIAIVDTKGETAEGNIYDGIYSGATLWAYPSTDTDSINEKLSEYIKSPDSVIAMYMVPSAAVGTFTSGKLPSGSRGGSITQVAKAIAVGDSLDGYIPKNNKLYTYPYNFFHVDNASGSALSLRYEFFQRLLPYFEINMVITQPVQMCLKPGLYKNITGAVDQNETLQVNSFPTCSWNTDYYAAWCAQNTIPTAVSAGGGILGSILPMIIKAPLGLMNPASQLDSITGAVGSALSSATTAINNTYTASIAADISKGSANNGNVNTSSHSNMFWGGRCCITSSYARVIDDFFSKFGYACNRLKIPNRSSRPQWNYVKTASATLTGSVPADDMKKLCAIYDNGITFWKNGNNVGNYSLDNRPGGGASV